MAAAIPFDCRFAVLGQVASALLPTQPITVPDDDGEATSLHDTFFLASGGVVSLKDNYSSMAQPYEPGAQVAAAASLHGTLSKLTQNPPSTVPVPRLGVIFSNVFTNSQIFGLMFDTGLIDPDAPESPISSVPRQGCAVFLQTIRNARPDKDNYAKQVSFDLAHEIGHIFNLQHVLPGDELCFMNQSSLDTPPDIAAYQFTGSEQGLLAECGSDFNITPGGSEFGSGNTGNTDHPSNPSRSASHLRLDIRMQEMEFWPWEGVELDLRLSSKKETNVPDQLDPGYRNFQIWIETPSGERRLYRSPHHFCAYPKSLGIGPGNPFVRDIPLFQQAGGYTFCNPGIHQLWIDFYPARGLRVRSNVLKIHIKGRPPQARKSLPHWKQMKRLHQAASRVLFFKSGAFRPREEEALQQIMKIARKEHAGAIAQYALALLYCDQARRKPQQRKPWIEKALPILRAAKESDQLGEYRRKKADQLFDKWN
jgi:hypothetical protein